MATNSVVRLILDDSQYSKKLRDVKNETTGMDEVIGGAGKVVGKLAGALGVAVTAGEAFKKFMSSSQTLGDTMTRTMDAARVAVDEFFFSLGSGQMDNFLSNLDAMIRRAKDASTALDVLGNTQISYGVFSAKNQADIADAQYYAKNKFAPMETRREAFANWRAALENQQGANAALQRELMNAATTAVASKAGADVKVTFDEIMEAFAVDLMTPEKRDLARSRAYQGATNYFEWTAAHKGDVYKEDRANLLEIQKQNIITYTMLEKYSDEELNAIAEKVTAYHSLQQQLKSISREYNETAMEFNNANKSMAGFVPVASLEGFSVFGGTTGAGKSAAPAGSMAALDEAIKNAQKTYANAVGVEAQTAAHKTLEELKRQKGEIEFIVKFTDGKGRELKDLTSGDLPSGLPTKASLTNTPLAKFETPITSEAVNNVDNYVEGLNAVANVMGALNATNVEGAAGWMSYASSVMQASAMVVSSIEKIIGAKTAETAVNAAASAAASPVVGWLMVGAAITSALAAMANIPSFATGGIVGGSNYTDGITARVSSGEMVINEADQKKLFEQIHSGGIGGGGGRAVVTGEQIVLAVNNYGKRTGRGELI